MRKAQSAALTGASALLLTLSAACTPDDGGSGAAGGGSPGAAPHAYRGTYEVPVPAELASAAVFDVPEVEWRIADGTATLEYALPLGLVGKKLRVAFTGSLAPSASTATLTGPPGTAECSLTGAAVVCNESMAGLLPMTPDYAVIEQVAKADFPGAASQRIDVAKRFSLDPIGIVRVDLGAPAGETETETEKPEG